MAGLVEQSTVSSASSRAHTGPRTSRAPAFFIAPFDHLFAPVVAAWPKTSLELSWLAPGTTAPLTPAKVCAWDREDGRRFLLLGAADDGPCGYAERNRMPDERRRYWIGHFVIDPARRGEGLSHVFFHNLVVHAFEEMGAAEVLLVVIPENAAAVRCYERGGMVVCGRESKRFNATGIRHSFLRMSLTRKRYERLDMYRNENELRAPFVRSAVGLLNRRSRDVSKSRQVIAAERGTERLVD